MLAFGLSPCVASSLPSSDLPNKEVSQITAQCLPASVDGLSTSTFSAEQLATAKKDRNTILAGYTGAKNKLTITVYVYDRLISKSDADLKEMKNAAASILMFNNGSELVADGTGTLPIAGTITDASVALFAWTDFDGEHGSFLWLVPVNKHYIKLRVTYLQPPDDKGENITYVRDMTFKVAKSICKLN